MEPHLNSGTELFRKKHSRNAVEVSNQATIDSRFSLPPSQVNLQVACALATVNVYTQ